MSNIPLLGPDGHGPVPNYTADLETIEQMIKNKNLFPKCKQIDEFIFKKKINKSKTSFVAKVEDELGEEFVMKKLKYYKGDPELGMSGKSLREIFILSRLNHSNIIGKEGIALDNSRICGRNYILLEYCSENLVELLDNVEPLDQPEIKCLMNMLVSGLSYLYDNLVIHRNICPNNILMHPSGLLKIADFGESRICTKMDQNENNCAVGTPGYRAPELILGHKTYTRAIDMWSCGTVFGYILLGKSLFSSSSNDIDQMNDVIKLCGSPKENEIKNFSSHEFVRDNVLKKCSDDKFNIVFQTHLDVLNLIDFVKSLLTYDEKKRLKPEECLHHKYLNCKPFALQPLEIMTRLKRKRKNQESDILPNLIEAVEIARRNVDTQPPLTSPQPSTSRTEAANNESLSEGEIESSSSESNSRDRNYSTSRRN